MSRRSLSLSTLSAIVVGLGATSAAHGAGFQLLEPVSYTHLTLPTIYSV